MVESPFLSNFWNKVSSSFKIKWEETPRHQQLFIYHPDPVANYLVRKQDEWRAICFRANVQIV